MEEKNMHIQDNMNEGEMPTLLREYAKRKQFKKNLQEANYNYTHANEKAEIGQVRSLKNINWKRFKVNAVAVAAIAIFSVFSTLWLSGYYKNLEVNSSNYRELRRDMNTVKRNVHAQNRVLQGINSTIGDQALNNFGATGFLLSNKGYVVTNYHVVADADSVQLQNAQGQSFSASIVYTDEKSDLAILKIADPSYLPNRSIPYVFRDKAADLGEDVFTLGYPRDEAVYGQGYLSSKSGYSGDTSAYQISIPLNPGNSGGPLLDSRGNVIGIVSGKQAGLDGTSFAIKTKTLLATLKQIPDSIEVKPHSLTNRKNSLSGLPRTEQVKRIQEYVYLVKVF